MWVARAATAERFTLFKVEVAVLMQLLLQALSVI
jgi:hypothetical protein